MDYPVPDCSRAAIPHPEERDRVDDTKEGEEADPNLGLANNQAV